MSQGGAQARVFVIRANNRAVGVGVDDGRQLKAGGF
jgi:hypothetical protein